MLYHHVINTGINNENAVSPIDIDRMIGEEGGEPYVKVRPLCFDFNIYDTNCFRNVLTRLGKLNLLV
jgi:hypothetical protein